MKPCQVVFTTVIRGATDADMHGFLYVLDLPAGTLRRKRAIPPQSFVVGSRGGSRGGRGVARRGDRLLVAVFDKILVYDQDLALINDLFHPWVVGHHEILVEEDGVWCCSTLIDALVKLDWNGDAIDAWFASEDEWFTGAVGARLVPRDRQVAYARIAESDLKHFDDQCHFNQVFTYAGGTYAYSHLKSALVRFRPDRAIACVDSNWKAAHNACVVGERFLINNTQLRRLEIYRRSDVLTAQGVTATSPQPVTIVPIDEGEELSNQFATSGWVRGLSPIDDRHVAIGSSPIAVIAVDIGRGEVVRRYEMGDDVREAVHGLCVVPAEFIRAE